MHLLPKLCAILLLIVITIISIISPFVSCSESQIFRINKLNNIWNKAKHSLGTVKLKDLKNDLEKHEQSELNLKNMKAHNKDKDGLYEAGVRKRLLAILSKYSLDRYFDDFHPLNKEEHMRKKVNLGRVKEPLTDKDKHEATKFSFRDKRLDKLWKKAEQTGFSADELMILHEEFQHQQDRLDEHYKTMNELHSISEEEQGKMGNNIEDNFDHKRKLSSEKKETASEKKERLNINLNQELKDKYKSIKKDIDNLHKKVLSGRVGDDLAGPYEEEAVNKLWSVANNENFTESELVSLKEELNHFETRIKKLKHFQNQLEKHSIGQKDSGSYGEQSDEEKHIKNRVEELKRQVAKTHETIKKKIRTHKDEL